MTDSVINLREEALAILVETLEKGAYIDKQLNSALEKFGYLKKQERAFLSRLCIGTVEQAIYLDYVLDLFSTVKVKKMKLPVRNILRLGVYQLLFMDGVPDSAACNESVKLAVKKGFKSLKGFVNGVLRNIARNKEKIQLPSKDKETEKYLSIKYSMPQWIVRNWIQCYGLTTAEKIISSLLADKPVTIRCNTIAASTEEIRKSLEQEGIAVEKGCYFQYAFFLSNYDSLSRIKAFQNGWFQVQDESSMMAAEAAGVKEGDYVIDTCAAPGGKSLHIAEKLKGSGLVSARDISEEKIDLIRQNKARLHISNIEEKVVDALEYKKEDGEKADIVIADLPCSGLGVIAKKPDIKYHVSEEQMTALEELQRRILGTVCRYVKPGGTLIFSTCTINRRENEENAAWFLKEHPEFTADSLVPYLPVSLKDESMKNGMLQLLPGIHNTDGFFLARLKRKG